MRTKLMLVAALLLAPSGAARANTISTFNLTATMMDGSVPRTVTLDQTAGTFTN